MTRPDSPQDPKRQVLKDVFGFDDFRPGQEQAVDTILSGNHVLTVMPTGSGKSLCFQVPALVMGGLTIVVSPLVALMQDQVAALRLAGVAAESINSSRHRDDNVMAWKRAASGQTRLLYMAPERLMTDRMLAALSKLPISLIAIDEAHCISQWGPAFRPEYEALSRLREVFPGVPVAALTATADEVTRADIAQRLFGGRVEMLVLGFDRPNIKLTVEPKHEWKKQLLSFVKRHPGQSGIVYCLSRKKTEEAAEFLVANGVLARAYHAGMDKEGREVNQNAFMTEPGMVMVATIAFGMGIDKSDVRFVFHADLPGSLEAYYQEIGRAGRDGGKAEAHMLFGLADIRMRRMFIDQEEAGEERKRREHQRLDALLGYCEAPMCRRQILLAYFGEPSEPCGNCDLCLNPVALEDRTEDARKALSAVHRSGERYGAAHVIDILRGADNEKVISAGHHELPVFGAGAGRKKEEWRSMIRQLVAAGFLKIDIGGYGGLGITPKGRALMHGDEVFRFRPEVLQRAGKRKGREIEAMEDMSGEDVSLLASLKELRLRLAKERQVPAYVIFSDRSLADMALRRPRDSDQFAEVNGVGAAKLREFGDMFLTAIRDHRDTV
ncbi:DNA helicase RecQ [Iodidimonas sp. SYSU 1G8]|uniref:DNA helicase RecQ n=1 Tax=Iodidimonas sp. SYSU 1G8 TaxID=3133967 RepID=UPI0031FF2079